MSFHSAISSLLFRVTCRFTCLTCHASTQGILGRYLNENRQKVRNIYVKNISLMWFLNYLAESPEVSRENFENSPHVLLFRRRRKFAQNNVVDFGSTPATAYKSMRSRHVTQSNGVVVRKSSIHKLPNKQCHRKTLLKSFHLNQCW